ncbi:MAG: hypothetical protein J6V24_13270, partial [Clostridia bacterium]|nr:hypothetical protein [Clostridia bacterium]
MKKNEKFFHGGAHRLCQDVKSDGNDDLEGKAVSFPVLENAEPGKNNTHRPDKSEQIFLPMTAVLLRIFACDRRRFRADRAEPLCRDAGKPFKSTKNDPSGSSGSGWPPVCRKRKTVRIQSI